MSKAGVSDREGAPRVPKSVLRSSLAGSWYPADPAALRGQIEGFYKKAEVEPRDDTIAVILPHAGYRYSGQTAVEGLKRIGRQYKRIIVIGPSHRVYMEDVLSVPRVTHYETPLGEIPLDVEFIGRLLQYPVFQNVPRAHTEEHSVQIEVPLLQHKQKDFKLVPIVAGQCSLDAVRRAGDILRSLVDNETLVVASSDFVHYGSPHRYVPFRENIPEQIKKLDMGAFAYIAKLDDAGFLQYKKKTGATICGSIPIAILLSMMSEGAETELVSYTTSGELMGDFSNSVSYLSAAFAGAWQNAPEIRPEKAGAELTDEDKRQLLTLARKTIRYVLGNRRLPEPSELGFEVTEAVKPPRAAFVTLKKNARLRGCIGDIYPQRPLHKSVALNAVYASLRDGRFPPVTEAELDEIEIEISALTTPRPVESANQIRIGTDGVVLNKDGHSAVFLPQVAPEQGWDLEQTLTQLSRKAGLDGEAWRDGASFLVFQAEVFGEER
ncbi:MAG: AmmeMemoRadiSam system protein B [Phycisphaerales bacterium]|nr:MAG: AmmeMemoRadiSam system protein B [Phycisphaerales bacterium]